MSKDTYRYIVIGDTAVGKSSLLLQFTERRFNTEHDMTLGVEMGSRTVDLSGQAVKLEIWDTAGQESYLSITRSYYRGADGCLLVFDLTNRVSFESLSMWLSEAKQNSNNPNLVILMIGNKADLRAQRAVAAEEVEAFAQANALIYLEVSAQNYSQVEEAFLHTAEEIAKKLAVGRPQQAPRNTLKLGGAGHGEGKGAAAAAGRGGGGGRGGRRREQQAAKGGMSGDCCK